jgi:hypothetical protein
MEITLKEITIGDIVKGYKDNNEQGVVGYGGLLDIRPAYQREFVYKDKQRNAVIDTISKGFPLNVMYWAKNNNGTYELLDGQQRTISFCQFVNGDFSVINKNGNPQYFHNMTEREQADFLSYKLFIYVCDGADDERLDWFRTINIAGEKLTDQELLNANYVGSWLSSAKLRFSKNNCVAYNLGNKYVKGSPIRQEYLETAIDWISDGKIAEYMAAHQFDENSDELLEHYKKVIEWIEKTFTTYRKEMCGLDWGKLYKTYGDNEYDTDKLEEQIKDLMMNDEVTDKKGVYEYVLSGCDEYIARKLSKRSFSNTDKRTAYERQDGICPKCGEHHEFSEMEGDHIVPWWRGGKTTLDNLQMLCKKCNGVKGGKAE